MSWLELFREFEVAKRKREDERERDLVLAWHIEALHRQKTLPTLHEMLQKPLNQRQHALLAKAKIQLMGEIYKVRQPKNTNRKGRANRQRARA